MSRKKLAWIVAAAVCAPIFIAGMISGAKDSLTAAASSTPAATPPAAHTGTRTATAKPTPKASSPKPVSATDPAIIDAAFAGTVIADDADLQQYSYDQLAQTGRQICTDIRHGTTVHDEAVTLMAVYGAKGAGVLLEVAPDAYCKNLKSSIEQQLKNL